MDTAWIELPRPKPPKVEDIYRYWEEEPKELSERCRYWQACIEQGWRPNRYWRAAGYVGSARLFGVYIWEYLYVLWPALNQPVTPDDQSGPANM